MPDLAKGDVVQLKSGGPIMTVSDIGDYSHTGLGPKEGAKCTWFEGKKNVEKVFDVSVLAKRVVSGPITPRF